MKDFRLSAYVRSRLWARNSHSLQNFDFSYAVNYGVVKAFINSVCLNFCSAAHHLIRFSWNFYLRVTGCKIFLFLSPPPFLDGSQHTKLGHSVCAFSPSYYHYYYLHCNIFPPSQSVCTTLVLTVSFTFLFSVYKVPVFCNLFLKWNSFSCHFEYFGGSSMSFLFLCSMCWPFSVHVGTWTFFLWASRSHNNILL